MYKQLTFLLFFLFFSFCSVAQHEGRIKNIPSHVYEVPREYRSNVKALTDFLVTPCGSEEEKALAIFAWIADNIKYDVKRFLSGDDSEQTVEETLAKRKGVCTHYSELFHAMCKLAGLKTMVIDGYAKGAGYRKKEPFIRANHAWNMIKLNGEWHALDMTWGSGFVWYYDYTDEKAVDCATKRKRTYKKLKYFKDNDFDYFLIPPEKLITSHFPWRPEFQLLKNPIDIQTFEKDSILDFSYEGSFDYQLEMDRNASLPKDKLKYKTGYDSRDYNSKNNFDKAVAVILENDGRDRNVEQEITLDKKEYYQEMYKHFEKSKILLDSHAIVLKYVNKERGEQINALNRKGRKVITRNVKSPISGRKLKKSIKPLRRIIAKSRINNSKYYNSLGENRARLGNAERVAHQLEKYEWSTIQQKIEQYEEGINSIRSLEDTIVRLKNMMYQDIVALKAYLKITRNEEVMSGEMDTILGTLDKMKSLKVKQSNIKKIMNENKLFILRKHSLIRQKITKEKLLLKRLYRSKNSNKDELDKRWVQNASDAMDLYENKIKNNNLKIEYYEDKESILRNKYTFYLKVDKLVDKYADALKEYILKEEEIKEIFYEKEKILKNKWKKYASDEQGRYRFYLEKIKRLELKLLKEKKENNSE